MRSSGLRIIHAGVSRAIQGISAVVHARLPFLICPERAVLWRDSDLQTLSMDTSVRSPMDGPSFYDDEHIFVRYQQVRTRPDAPSQTLEQPTVLKFLGDLRGRSLLDLGCGDAWIGRYALEQGADRYLGIDGSHRMLEEARRMLSGTPGEVQIQNLERWCGGDIGVFDVVVSRLALHYINNLGCLLEIIRHHLRVGGLLVFSIEHPVMTANYGAEIVDGIARTWKVRNYFREGAREDHWLNAVVVKHHRTIETYIHELRRCGFQLDQFAEGKPDIGHFLDQTQYEARLDVPMCAIFRCIRGV